MSQVPATPDPLELVTQGFEALNRRDFDAVVSSYAPDAVLDFTAWGIGTFAGRPAIKGFFEDWLRSYAEYRAEIDETLDPGHGVVFVAYRERARPTGGQGHLEWRRGYVVLLRDGLVERMTLYDDTDEARAASERLAEERG